MTSTALSLFINEVELNYESKEVLNWYKDFLTPILTNTDNTLIEFLTLMGIKIGEEEKIICNILNIHKTGQKITEELVTNNYDLYERAMRVITSLTLCSSVNILLSKHFKFEKKKKLRELFYETEINLNMPVSHDFSEFRYFYEFYIPLNIFYILSGKKESEKNLKDKIIPMLKEGVKKEEKFSNEIECLLSMIFK